MTSEDRVTPSVVYPCRRFTAVFESSSLQLSELQQCSQRCIVASLFVSIHSRPSLTVANSHESTQLRVIVPSMSSCNVCKKEIKLFSVHINSIHLFSQI